MNTEGNGRQVCAMGHQADPAHCYNFHILQTNSQYTIFYNNILGAGEDDKKPGSILGDTILNIVVCRYEQEYLLKVDMCMSVYQRQ